MARRPEAGSIISGLPREDVWRIAYGDGPTRAETKRLVKQEGKLTDTFLRVASRLQGLSLVFGHYVSPIPKTPPSSEDIQITHREAEENLIRVAKRRLK